MAIRPATAYHAATAESPNATANNKYVIVCF